MYCGQCGKLIGDASRYCSYCGAAQEPKEVESAPVAGIERSEGKPPQGPAAVQPAGKRASNPWPIFGAIFAFLLLLLFTSSLHKSPEAGSVGGDTPDSTASSATSGIDSAASAVAADAATAPENVSVTAHTSSPDVEIEFAKLFDAVTFGEDDSGKTKEQYFTKFQDGEVIKLTDAIFYAKDTSDSASWKMVMGVFGPSGQDEAVAICELQNDQQKKFLADNGGIFVADVVGNYDNIVDDVVYLKNCSINIKKVCNSQPSRDLLPGPPERHVFTGCGDL